MKNDKFFITPDMMPRLDVDLENIDFERLASKEHQKEFKKSKAYKYVKRTLDREKNLNKQQRKDWWKENSWNIINTLIAIAALIISALK
jgi:hypothetical protein